MKVWITLTEPGATRLAREFSIFGYTSVCESVTQIHFLPPNYQPNRTNKVPSLLIFLSQHAAEQYLNDIYCEAHNDSKFLAIGPRTAEKLRAVGLHVLEPAHSNSEGLLASPWVAQLSEADGVWIVCGERGRDKLHLDLAQRCDLTVVTLYRRIPRSVASERIRGADIILIGSVQAFDEVSKAWNACGGDPLVKFVVPSERVAERGLELGFSQVITAGNMNSESLLQAMARVQNG